MVEFFYIRFRTWALELLVFHFLDDDGPLYCDC